MSLPPGLTQGLRAPEPTWRDRPPGRIAERPEPSAPYWDPERETAPPAVREAVILRRLRAMLVYVYDRTPFYRDLYDRHGLTRRTLETLPSLAALTARVPVVTKDMLIEAQARCPPLGDYLAVDRSALMRIQGTSGTTRRSTLLALTRDDWRHVAEAQALQMWAAGVRPSDVVQVAFPLGLYVGGWGLLSAAERIGAVVLPLAGASSQHQIELMAQARATVLCATPSYALRLIEVARGMGRNPAASSWRMVFLGGEAGGAIAEVRARIEAGLGVRAVDFGNVAELHPCSNMECAEGGGMHVYQDVVYTEIVEPDRPARACLPGTPGALVYTHLWRQAMPMVRYYAGDWAVMTDAPCACGRTYPRLPRGVIGRLDDQINLRGVKFYPSDVENVVRAVPEAGSEFQMAWSASPIAPEFEVCVEAAPDLPQEAYEALDRRLRDAFREALGVRLSVRVVAPDTLPRPAFKARRLVRVGPREGTA